MTKPTTPKVTTGTTLPEDWRDTHVHTQHFTPNPVERGTPGKTTRQLPTDPPQAINDLRSAINDIQTITAGLWTTITAYEQIIADGYPATTPGGDHPREHGEPVVPTECPKCGWIGPCPEHGPVQGTTTEWAAHARIDAGRRLHELERRILHLRHSAADARSYHDMIRAHLGAIGRTDTERRTSLCGIPGCDLDALTDLAGAKVIVHCADGVERQLCDRHHREATTCALGCGRKAETQPSGKVRLHGVIVEGVAQHLQLCTTCRLTMRQSA